MLALIHETVCQPDSYLLRRVPGATALPSGGVYPDYYAATGAIAIDGTGHMVFAYTFSSKANVPSPSTYGLRTTG